jgi:hypothetical protein
MKASRRVIGKIFTYLGLFLAGMGLIGTMGPYMDLQKSGRVTAQVVANELAFNQPGVFAYRLQLKNDSMRGEQRTTLTTVVRAATEEKAWANYKGNHLVKGQTYEFFTDPENPERLQPFKGYNFATFGKFAALGLAGVLVFFVGMTIVRKEKGTR